MHIYTKNSRHNTSQLREGRGYDLTKKEERNEVKGKRDYGSCDK